MRNLTIERQSTLTGSPRLEALTGLRFFAVLLVVLHHFWTPSAHAPPGVPPRLWEAMSMLAAHGFIGVSLFFVLSGFVLTYSYDPVTRGLDRRAFWAARLARIYPMYLLALAVALPDLWRDLAVLVQKYGLAFGTAWGLVKGGMVLGLIQAWVPSGAMFWNAPAWSLSAEAFFYLLFPLLVTTRLFRDLSVSRASLGLVLMGALVLGMGLLIHAVRLWRPTIDVFQLIGMAPIFRLPEFLAGMLLGQAFLRMGTPTGRFRRKAGLVSGLAMVGFLLLNATLAVPDELAIALNLPLVVALVGGLAFGSGPLAALLSRPRLVLLGEASYGIYLLHVPFGNRFLEIRGQAHGAMGPGAFAAFLGLTILASCLLYRFYEDPLRQSLRRVLAGPRPAPAEPRRPREGCGRS